MRCLSRCERNPRHARAGVPSRVLRVYRDMMIDMPAWVDPWTRCFSLAVPIQAPRSKTACSTSDQAYDDRWRRGVSQHKQRSPTVYSTASPRKPGSGDDVLQGSDRRGNTGLGIEVGLGAFRRVLQHWGALIGYDVLSIHHVVWIRDVRRLLCSGTHLPSSPSATRGNLI